MEFFGDLSVPVKILAAFVVALAMLAAGAYLVRRFRLARTEPRLALIDAASVDGRRRLVLVRRDNVEHLLLIGGPTDVVIEPNINRTGTGATAPAPVREPKASPTKPPPHQTLSEGMGSSPPPPRPDEAIEAMLREPVTREPMPSEATNRDATRAPPVPVERQRLETLIEEAGAPPLPDAGPASYPRPSFEPAFQIPPVPEPERMPAPRLPQRAAQGGESNLAEMAQQLQAALRRLR
jgi:flagellar protein FliO/FliZ